MKARMLFCTTALLMVSASGSMAAEELPAGEGRELIEGVCTSCHQENQIVQSSGYTREQWASLISSMIDLSANDEIQDGILTYLSEHFPPNDRRASKVVAGPRSIKFQEWVAPTLGQRARDPVEAPDGKIWWVGQFGNVIGRLDPETGAIEDFPLPEGARPHSVSIDADGNPWYMGNGNGTIGKVDPRTGEVVKVYKMPDAAARDPHTGEFDRDGVLWFTLQQSNMFGRLDPKTGDIKLVTAKTPGARPYGVKIDSEGNPWFACNGSNCLVKVDAKTMELTEIKLPTPGTTVRRLDIAEDGAIWFVNSSKGKIGRYIPETGDIKEWDSPSGPNSHPYGMAVIDGIVWYNESGVRPDMLVRFNPESENFQSWPIASGEVFGGIVRHMRATKSGDLLIHQSSTNRIIRVPVRSLDTSS